MRLRISCLRLAVIAAGGAVVLTVGLAGTTSAADAAGNLVYTTSQAGYVAGGGPAFRYIATTVTVAAAPAAVFDQSLAEVVLGSSNGPPVTLAVPAGGGANSVSFSWKSGTLWNTGHFAAVAPASGDTLILGIYYDQQGHDFLTANDVTKHVSQTVEVDVVPVNYTAAEAAGVVNNATVVPPQADTRLWEFTSTAVTTTTGVRGTLLGPWTTSQVIDTQNGTATSPVVISSPLLWDNGQNFGVWLRATA